MYAKADPPVLVDHVIPPSAPPNHQQPNKIDSSLKSADKIETAHKADKAASSDLIDTAHKIDSSHKASSSDKAVVSSWVMSSNDYHDPGPNRSISNGYRDTTATTSRNLTPGIT